MESKPTVEQFMSNFFRERTTALKMVLENRRDYRLRFYCNECDWDSHRGVVEQSEAEEIVSVSPSDIGADVVTTGHGVYQSRYQVKSSGETWLICAMDLECGHCRVFGASTECSRCGGTGWLNWKVLSDLSKRQEQRAAGTIEPSLDEKLDARQFCDPAIEQFMNQHFRERTAALKKEFEIYAEFALRFCRPECGWTRWIVSVAGSEAERFVSIVPVEAGAQVTTRGFGTKGHGLRYHLRPTGQDWLIVVVDLECLACYQRGRRAGCSFCGGMGWLNRIKEGGFARGEQPGEEPPPDRPRWKLE
jgi:hypothetical protein